MKKLFLILTTALFAAGFASCTDDPEETVNPVVVSEILRALGGNVLVNVPEENFDVNIPADAASWVQYNGVNKGKRTREGGQIPKITSQFGL